MLQMTMRVKLRDRAADGGFTNILFKPLNLKGLGSVLKDRAPVAAVDGDGSAYEKRCSAGEAHGAVARDVAERAAVLRAAGRRDGCG